MIKWTVIFRPSNVCQEISILLRAFLEKLPGCCSIDINQSSKYFKKTFCSQSNRSSFTEVKGAKNGFLSNSRDWMMLRMFIISKKLSSNKQNFAVPAASGGLYDVNVLLTVELNTDLGSFSLGKFGPKIWSSSNWLKCRTGAHCYMLISILMLIFQNFSHSYFSANLVPKSEVLQINWNLVQRYITVRLLRF